MARDLDIDPRALAELAASVEVRRKLSAEAEKIRDRARKNAEKIGTDLVEAIDTEEGRDADGIFSDIGYRKDRPGFVLWWHEVGTKNHPATPHLRPAVKPGD